MLQSELIKAPRTRDDYEGAQGFQIDPSA